MTRLESRTPVCYAVLMADGDPSPSRMTIRDHLRDAELGYFGHMRFAFGIGARLIGAGLAAMVHGLLPSVFPTRAGQVIDAIHAEAVQDRARRASRKLGR
jgi:hypothetical protein